MCFEECIVHLPEAALDRSGFGCLRGDLGVGMSLCQGEDAEDKAYSGPEPFAEAPDYRVGPHRVGAFVVAILDQRYQRVSRSPNPVVLANRRDEL